MLQELHVHVLNIFRDSESLLENSFGVQFFPDIQYKSLPEQLEAVYSCPFLCYLGKETTSHHLPPFREL